MSCPSLFIDSGGEIEPRMTRIYTDKAEAQGGARCLGLAMRFQIPSQASLHGIVQTHRSLASRAALLWLFTLGACPSTPEGTGLRLARQAGRCFGKASASSLASVFSKQLRHSCNESILGFSGQQTGSSSSVVIREIRG